MSDSAKILLTLPSGEIRKYGIELESIRIGRAADNTVVIEDPSLSAHHCVLRRVGAGSNFSIEDLESTNGLEVNGEDTTMAELSHGDIVKIGEIMMLFMQAGRPALAPLEPYVENASPANDDDSEDAENSIDDVENFDEDAHDDFEGDDTPPPPKQKKKSKQKPATQKPSERQNRQDHVQVEKSRGCGGAIVSLIILLLAPVVGLCVHYYRATGRFLLLDLISGSGQ